MKNHGMIVVTSIIIFSLFCWAALASKYQQVFSTLNHYEDRVSKSPTRINSKARDDYGNNRSDNDAESYTRSRSTIVKVQQQLYAQGFMESGPTGIIDKETKNALNAFQRDKGLLPTGSLNVATLNSLGIRTEESLYSE